MATGTVADLRGVAAYARGAGARRLVLMGASLGGITTGKLAGELGATAMVVISAVEDLSAYGLTVSAAELASMIGPKLFIASEDDTNTPFADTKAFYEHAGSPKQFKSFPGGGHGLRILPTAYGVELRQIVIDFVTTAAPPNGSSRDLRFARPARPPRPGTGPAAAVTGQLAQIAYIRELPVA